jgi:hypothetical protein
MSTLQVANVWLETTANNRVQYAGSNTYNFYAGGIQVVTVNSAGMYIFGRAPSTAPMGGGTDKLFYENDTVMTTDYTITSGKNAGTFGPVTINSEITVTIPSGSVWSIV